MCDDSITSRNNLLIGGVDLGGRVKGLPTAHSLIFHNKYWKMNWTH